MNLVIPMGGKGTRLRPHTISTQKAMIPVAGVPIVVRLVTTIIESCPQITNIGFIVNCNIPLDTKEELGHLTARHGVQAHFYDQPQALGTAHAVSCARPLLHGPLVVAFADTLFQGLHMPLETSSNIVWTQQVNNPESFGVVEVKEDLQVIRFVEKPTTWISDQAVIGVYYFRDGRLLLQALEILLKQPPHSSGEYQLTDVLTYMHTTGELFKAQPIETWLDCGEISHLLHANRWLLNQKGNNVHDSVLLNNSTIIPPVYVGEWVIINDSIIGPHVSIGPHTKICNSELKNSLIFEHALLEKCNLNASVVGNYVQSHGLMGIVSLGDYTVIKI